MGEARSTYGRDEKCIQSFSQKNINRKERDLLEDLDRDVRITVKRDLSKSDVRVLTGFI